MNRLMALSLLVFQIGATMMSNNVVKNQELWDEGVSRELARHRAANISDLRYQLRFELTPGATRIKGRQEIRLKLNDTTDPVILDFRDLDERGRVVEGVVSNVTANGSAVNDMRQTGGHLVLPARHFKSGENTIAMDFETAVATANRPIIRYQDRDDGREYLYTLFVPMDASMAFPCFDQPDLKARFTLTVIAPPGWSVISNTSPEGVTGGLSLTTTKFAETRPISTYLFAFAAGPFRKVHETPGMPGLYVRQSKFKRAEEEAAEVQEITAAGMKYLADYFAQPFPFPKYDMVMIPGFAYGGMEHAGATFLREESILFRTAPTHSDHLSRDILLLHELTHQWFGDLVTMRWFDDLWLKEGFAQYMAYHALADLKPNENVWKRFYQAIKPAAYGIDSTQGTTPIYQDIGNLKDAKSAYGAIVYSKAPGVLKQLAFVLGEDHFRDGLRLYLKEHAYANAEWSDLVGAFEQVSKKSLGEWANAYIKRRGMPQVDVEWTCDANSGEIISRLRQKDVLGEGGSWPIATQVLLMYPGQKVVMRADVGKLQAITSTVPVDEHDHGCPQFIFANHK